jgi:hypothetical protein
LSRDRGDEAAEERRIVAHTEAGEGGKARLQPSLSRRSGVRVGILLFLPFLPGLALEVAFERYQRDAAFGAGKVRLDVSVGEGFFAVRADEGCVAVGVMLYADIET